MVSDKTVLNFKEFKEKYGRRGFSVLIETLIKRMPSFDNDVAFAQNIGTAVADFESALKYDIEESNANEDSIRKDERANCIRKLEALPKGTWGDENGERSPWPIAIKALKEM